MPYLYVENFEAGLDTRKSRYTAPPGSLRVLKNAHITRGKEIERRKAFSALATLPAGTFGLHAVQDRLWVFGSGPQPTPFPGTVKYQRLQHPDGVTAMTALLSTDNFRGRIYAVAEFADGNIYHYYDGTRVTAWDSLSESISSNDAVATALAERIDAEAAYDAVASGPTVTVTAANPGTGFTYDAEVVSDEVLATGQFSLVTEGTEPFTMSSVKVGSVELLSAPLTFEGIFVIESLIAQTVRGAINANSENTGFTAAITGTIPYGSKYRYVIGITAPAGSGASGNGDAVTVQTSSNLLIDDVEDMAGGQDPQTLTATETQPNAPGQAQIVEFEIGGTFSPDTQFRITLDGQLFTTTGLSSGTPTFVRTFRDKMYAVAGSLLHFSGFSGENADPDPTQWQNNDDAGEGPIVIGAGFIDMSTQSGGAERLRGIGIYQSRLAVFSDSTVYLWSVDPDPAQNALYQTLINVGVLAPHTIVEYGDQDLFFLSDSGIRSLRARDSSNLASANDVGVAIDREVADYLLTLDQVTVQQAAAVLEPSEGRYLMALGERVYVFSNFPGSRVSAWSTYDVGGRVTDWATIQDRLYARVADTVRLYGGTSGAEYDDSETEVTLPFLDASNPAGQKQVTGIDMGLDGTWQVDIATEPNNPDVFETLAIFTESSYGSVQRVPAQARSTHFSLRLTTSEEAPAVLGNAVIHYDDLGAS